MDITVTKSEQKVVDLVIYRVIECDVILVCLNEKCSLYSV